MSILNSEHLICGIQRVDSYVVHRFYELKSNIDLKVQGSERIKGAYAYQTLLRYLFIARSNSFLHNILFTRASPKNLLPLGSDFPVEGVNPLLGFYAAVSRLSVDGTSPHGSGGW